MAGEKTEQAKGKKLKHRSPSYPFISLGTALEKAQTFYGAQTRHPAPLSAALALWDFGAKSSGGMQTISALKQFGLLEDIETTNARQVKLTEAALRIIQDERPISSERDAEIKRLALLPKIYSEMWTKWGSPPPPEATVKFFLVNEKKYNEGAFSDLFSGYKDTIEFAKLGKSDKDGSKEGVQDTPQGPIITPPSAPPPKGAKLMEGERIVFTHEVEPEHGVRVVASGDVDGPVLAALDTYVQQQRNRFFMANLEKLLNAGFVEIPSREMWYSRERRMAFSHQAIREMDPRWLERHLAEKVGEGGSDEFVFHFVNPPKGIQNCIEILKEIGLSKLHANIRLATLAG